MTYSTGSATSMSDLRAKILTFATGDSWSTVSASWPISDGKCFVNTNIETVSTFDAALGVSENKTLIYGALGTSLPGTAPSSWWEMPGFIGSSATDGAAHPKAYGARSDASIAEYHLFSGGGAAGTRYIHCALRNGADTWSHFSFGNADQKGLTHSGVGYIASSAIPNFPTDASGGSTSNQPSNMQWPFNGGAGGSANPATVYHCPNGLPVGFPQPIANRQGVRNTMLTAEIGTNAYAAGHNDQFYAQLSIALRSKPTPFNGRAAMYSCPIWAYDSTNVKYCWIGDYPNVRYMNMKGISAGDEIVLGSDTWKVFPVLRQNEAEAGNVVLGVSSEHMALAYLKVT
jgi:hypothetical protein